MLGELLKLIQNTESFKIEDILEDKNNIDFILIIETDVYGYRSLVEPGSSGGYKDGDVVAKYPLIEFTTHFWWGDRKLREGYYSLRSNCYKVNNFAANLIVYCVKQEREEGAYF